MKYLKDIQKTVLDSNGISFIWKGISEKLDCRLVVGTARAVFKIDDFIPIAVTLYPKEDTEGNLLESLVIEMRVHKLLNKLADGTLISYIEDLYLDKVTAEAMRLIERGDKPCRH